MLHMVGKSLRWQFIFQLGSSRLVARDPAATDL